MGFGILHSKCVALTSEKVDAHQMWRHLLTLPRLTEVLRRFYKAHPLLKVFLQKEIPSLLERAMSSDEEVPPRNLLRHMVLQIAFHEHSSDLEVREWAALCKELLSADQKGLRCCERMWCRIEAERPELINALRMYTHTTLSECNQRGAFVAPYDA